MGHPEAGRGAPAAALLGILATALLIPEASSLRCHSHESVLHHDRGGQLLDGIVTPNSTEACTPPQSACMEAFVTLSAGSTSLTLIQRGCSDGHPKGGTKPQAPPSGFLHVQVHVRYCQSDLCNAKETGPESPGQGPASAPSSSTQCYAGLSLDPQPHTLERVMCDRADARCYHGNGTLVAGKLVVPIFVWQCQAPSCAVPPSHHVGPAQLSQAGACCSGSYCNGRRDLAQVPPFLEKSRSRRGPSYDPLNNTLANRAWKDHKRPGPANGTAAPGPTRPAYEDPSHEYPDPSHEYPDFDITVLGPAFPDPTWPGHKGGTHPSARPRPRPTEPGGKHSHPKDTAHPDHKKPGAHGSQAPGLRFCPLLVMLAIARLGL